MELKTYDRMLPNHLIASLLFCSLEATYEALATSEVLGIGAKSDVKDSTCKSVVDTLSSPTSTLKDLFFGLRVNSLLKCELSDAHFTVSLILCLDSVVIITCISSEIY